MVHMARQCADPSGIIRTGGVWALSVWLLLAAVGNPTGAVLCVEADGSMSLESVLEQAECHHCQEQTRFSTTAEHAGLCSWQGACCFDIPLSLISASAVRPTAASRSAIVGRFASPTFISVPTVQPISSVAILVSCGESGDDSHPPAVLAALRTIVLRI